MLLMSEMKYTSDQVLQMSESELKTYFLNKYGSADNLKAKIFEMLREALTLQHNFDHDKIYSVCSEAETNELDEIFYNNDNDGENPTDCLKIARLFLLVIQKSYEYAWQKVIQLPECQQRVIRDIMYQYKHTPFYIRLTELMNQPNQDKSFFYLTHQVEDEQLEEQVDLNLPYLSIQSSPTSTSTT